MARAVPSPAPCRRPFWGVWAGAAAVAAAAAATRAPRPVGRDERREGGGEGAAAGTYTGAPRGHRREPRAAHTAAPPHTRGGAPRPSWPSRAAPPPSTVAWFVPPLAPPVRRRRAPPVVVAPGLHPLAKAVAVARHRRDGRRPAAVIPAAAPLSVLSTWLAGADARRGVPSWPLPDAAARRPRLPRRFVGLGTARRGGRCPPGRRAAARVARPVIAAGCGGSPPPAVDGSVRPVFKPLSLLAPHSRHTSPPSMRLPPEAADPPALLRLPSLADKPYHPPWPPAARTRRPSSLVLLATPPTSFFPPVVTPPLRPSSSHGRRRRVSSLCCRRPPRCCCRSQTSRQPPFHPRHRRRFAPMAAPHVRVPLSSSMAQPLPVLPAATVGAAGGLPWRL